MDEDLLDDAAAHTKAKHRILQEYLKGWLPILARGQRNRLLYFDGFAGCGELKGGDPGSPLVAIRTAVGAKSALNVPLHVRMVEEDAARCAYLRSKIQREQEEVSNQDTLIKIDVPVCGKCEAEVTKLLDDYEQRKGRVGPALFFLDQYGYSGFSMDLVRRILRHGMCETFSYLNWQRMHPYFTDPSKAETFTRAIGGDEWREVQPLRDQARVQRFKSIYVNSLRQRGGAKYVYDFAMRGPDHRLIYWLFFCTNSLKGLEVMKKAMWEVDQTGRFEFSDRDADQGMLTAYTQAMLAEDIYTEFNGREVSAEELKEHVLTRTPAYRSGEAIRLLKQSRRVTEQRRARATTYSFVTPARDSRGLFE